MTKDEKNEKIEMVLANFDFVKVVKVMDVLGRKWYRLDGKKPYVPSVNEFRSKARELLSMVMENIDKPMHTFCFGGLEACIGDNGTVTLRYVVEECYEEVGYWR